MKTPSRNWFIAWPVLDATEWLSALERSAPTGLDFTHPDDLHVTLAFLGNHDAANEKKIAGILRGLPLKGYEITTGRPLALPQPRRFSAIAASIDLGRPDLEKHIARWGARICRDAGAHVDTRAPLPHLTIARPARGITNDERDATLEWLDAEHPPAVRLTLAPPAIFRWADRDAAGRRYQIVPIQGAS